jgi:hypothetical protein
MAVVTQYDPADAPTYNARTVDRIVTGFGGTRCRIMQPLGTPKPREECDPFSYSLDTGKQPDVKAQEKFVKGLNSLKPRRVTKRKDGYSRHVAAFLRVRAR